MNAWREETTAHREASEANPETMQSLRKKSQWNLLERRSGTGVGSSCRALRETKGTDPSYSSGTAQGKRFQENSDPRKLWTAAGRRMTQSTKVV
jgi:hypothetical protein